MKFCLVYHIHLTSRQPTRSKFVYSCSVKIQALGFSELLESFFCLLLVGEAFTLQKVVEMLEEVVVGWREVR